MTVEERLAALEQRLRGVEDELAIRRLLASYGPLVDAGEGDVCESIVVRHNDEGRRNRCGHCPPVRPKRAPKWLSPSVIPRTVEPSPRRSTDCSSRSMSPTGDR